MGPIAKSFELDLVEIVFMLVGILLLNFSIRIKVDDKETLLEISKNRTSVGKIAAVSLFSAQEFMIFPKVITTPPIEIAYRLNMVEERSARLYVEISPKYIGGAASNGFEISKALKAVEHQVKAEILTPLPKHMSHEGEIFPYLGLACGKRTLTLAPFQFDWRIKKIVF